MVGSYKIKVIKRLVIKTTGILFLTLVPFFLFSQNIGINSSGTVADPSAGLDINFTNKGTLNPRLTTAQRDAITSPAEGLLIYNTDCHAFNYYNGTAWVSMNGSGSLNDPGSITGNTSVCIGAAGETYSISAVTGATSYTWTVPSGATITAGQGTTSITVTFGTTSGNVCVTANNDCFSSNVSCSSITVSSSISLSELKAYYKFNEASGNIINLASSVGSTDALSNADLAVTGASYSATGKIGNAISLDGVSDELNATSLSLPDIGFMSKTGGNFSMVIWAKFDNFSGLTALFRTYESGGITSGFLINVNADRTIRFLIGQETVDITSITTTIAFDNHTDWQMLCVTWDDATNTFSASINNGADETHTFNATNTKDAEFGFKFGRRLGGPLDMAGDFDEVSIWNRVLTDCEKTHLYNSGNGREL